MNYIKGQSKIGSVGIPVQSTRIKLVDIETGTQEVGMGEEGELIVNGPQVIVELNGTLSESSNMYDPRRSIWWTYGVLFKQWAVMYKLGQRRRKQGVKPMSLGEIIQKVLEHYHTRQGSAVSD